MKKYSYKYKVKLDDLDFMGIVGDSNWLTFLQRARIELLDELGFSFEKMSELKVGGAVAENHIQYLRSARFGEDLLVQITPTLFDKNSVNLSYEITNAKLKQCVLSNLRIVFIDVMTGRPVEVPEKIKTKVFEMDI